MRVMLALARREVLGALRSPRYYILVAFYLFAQGYYFSLLFIDDGAVAVRQLLRELAFLLLFAAPLVTAGSLAGEHESGELRQFLTEPVSEGRLVLGKALGGLILVLPLALGALLPAAAALYYGAAPAPALLVAVLGYCLLAATCGAVGLFASSFTRHAASAAACSLGILLFLALLGVQAARTEGLASFLTGATGPEAVNPFSLIDILFRGVVDTRPLVFFPAAALTFLALAVVVLRSRRWTYPGREGPQGVPRRSTRQSLVAVSLVGSCLPILLGFGVVHMVSARLHWSYDLSGYLTLSPAFRQAMAALPSPVTIYRVRQRSLARERIDDLLDEVARVGGGTVTIVPWQPNLHFAELRPLGLLVPPPDGIVVRMGTRVAAVAQSQLDVESHQAEASIAQAVNQVAPTTAGPSFLVATGHGEQDCEALQRLVSTVGFSARPLSLASVETIPLTSSVLAIIGPRVAFSATEVDTVQHFLEGGGRLLLCVDGEHLQAARPLLDLLPVSTPGGLVVDPTHSLAGGGATSLIVVPQKGHPVTERTGRLQIILPSVTPVTLRPNREDPLRANLVMAPATASSAPDATAAADPSRWSPVPATPLAVTCEGPRAVHPYRAAVVGDGDWLSDRILLHYPTNAIFAQALVTWLGDQPAPAGIPREPIHVRVILSKDESRTMLYVIAVLPSVLALGLGFLAWASYRRRFAASPR